MYTFTTNHLSPSHWHYFVMEGWHRSGRSCVFLALSHINFHTIPLILSTIFSHLRALWVLLGYEIQIYFFVGFLIASLRYKLLAT